jgi:Cu2+-exporting ATPase
MPTVSSPFLLVDDLGDNLRASFKNDGMNRLEVFDVPEEWAVFSQSRGESEGRPTEIWESQVQVQGMHCAACSLTLENSLLSVNGVMAVQVSAASQRATVVWSSALTRPSQWMAAPLAAGYDLTPAADVSAAQQGRKASRLALWRWLVAGFCMMQVMMYAFPAYVSAPGDITPDIEKLLRWASWVLTLPVLLFSCSPFFSNATRDLSQRRISMDLPVALGIAVTFAVSTAATFEPQGWWGREVYFDSLTMFVFFLLTGRLLEQRLRDRTAGSLDALMQRLPDSVQRQLADGIFERVSPRRLAVGDLIRVLPGEAFPVDGTIVAGHTFADEALLTGESHPIARPAGSAVLAGSYNLSAVVTVRIEQIGQATRYAQIVALMARAAVDKPRLALLADRIAKPFLWFVLLAALMAVALWWNTDPAKALMAAVAVLVVTCPCALSLATPTSMLTAAGFLARQGVLVRRLQAFESLAGIDTVVFDKTGTLTEARMGLQAVKTRDGISAEQALQLAWALARHSLHPVSRALVAGAADLADLTDLTDIKEFAGLGVEGTIVTGNTHGLRGLLRLGSARFCGLDGALHDGPPGSSQVFLVDESGWLAVFHIDEVLRPNASEVVTALQASGIKVEMLSGDGEMAARRVADRVGITTAYSDMTPQAKLAHLQALQRNGHRILMVGDGLNDGPALASACVSVAMGQAVPLAQAQCDFLVPGGQLLMIPLMLQQARRTMRIVRQNLCWAAAYNAVCVPLALAGFMPAWLAGLGMALSSLLVIANAARLSRSPRGQQAP